MAELDERHILVVAGEAAYQRYVDSAVARCAKVWGKCKILNRRSGDILAAAGENQVLMWHRVSPTDSYLRWQGFDRATTGYVIISPPNPDLLEFLQHRHKEVK
jgi:hypothetical protein